MTSTSIVTLTLISVQKRYSGMRMQVYLRDISQLCMKSSRTIFAIEPVWNLTGRCEIVRLKAFIILNFEKSILWSPDLKAFGFLLPLRTPTHFKDDHEIQKLVLFDKNSLFDLERVFLMRLRYERELRKDFIFWKFSKVSNFWLQINHQSCLLYPLIIFSCKKNSSRLRHSEHISHSSSTW